jgi:hypothetical protein
MAARATDAGPAGRPGEAQQPGRDYERLAEALIDDWTGRLRTTVVRVAARAREEAEDIVAEAQEARRSFGRR